MQRVIFIVLCVLSLGVFAQEEDDWGDVRDVDVIQATEVSTEKSFQNYWDEHIYGFVSGLYRVGPNHYGTSSEIKIGFNDRWEQIKVVLDISHRQKTIDTKVNEVSNRSEEVISTSRKVFKSGGGIQVRQAYIEYFPMDSVVLSAGKQTTVWGQLDIVSPVDLFLPLDFNSTGFTLVKLDNRMPQTTVRAAYYPANNIEVSGYYFPAFEESGLFKDVVDEMYSDDYFKEKYRKTNDPTETPIVLSPQKETPKTGGYAGRMVLYDANFTAGLTYYHGANNLYPVQTKRFVENGYVETGSFFDELPELEEKPVYETRYGYYPKTGVGFEFALPIGQWTLKFDGTISDELYNFNAPTTNEDAKIFNDHNNGNTNIFIYRAMYVVGIDADFDTWFYNFYVTGIKDFKNPQYNTFLNAIGKQPDLVSFFGLPTLNIGRYWNRDKKGGYGLSFGFLGSSWGIVSYMSNEISESFSWVCSAGFVLGFGDIMTVISGNKEDKDDDDTYNDYKFVSDPTINFGLSYKL
jgi:hypothetical protein